MRQFYGVLSAVAFFALLAVVTGCGETVIDSTKAEEQLQASLSKSLGTKVTAVDCPSDVKVEAGKTFTCTVEMKGGATQTAILKIRNEDADVSIISLSSSNGSNE